MTKTIKKSVCLEVQVRFEPNRYAQLYLEQTYARLVPLAKHSPNSGLAAKSNPQLKTGGKLKCVN